MLDLPLKFSVIEVKNNVSPNVLVSVCVITYNHAEYISSCIDGILSQKTDFDFEILLGDDDSSDGTREICINYAKKHPEKLRLFLHSRENNIRIGGKPTGRFNFLYNLSKSNGQFIALCDGDDYWTEPDKLQKQINFLKGNSNFSICFHNMQILYDGVKGKNKLSNVDQKEFTTILDLAKGNYIYTASCVFKNGLINHFPPLLYKSPIGDYPLHMLNAQYGKIKYIDEIMGVYRVHKKGIWEQQTEITRIKKTQELFKLFIDHFTTNHDVGKVLTESYVRHCLYIAKFYMVKDTERAKRYLQKTKNYKIRYKISNYYLSSICIAVRNIIRRLKEFFKHK